MRAISCLLLFALATGCFRRHTASGPGDDRPMDGGPRDLSPPVLDFAAPGDASRPDAAPDDCRPVPALVQACVAGDPSAFLEPGFLVQVESCHCGGELRCDLLRADEGSATVEVSICGEGDCRACTPPNEVFCRLPDDTPRTIVRQGQSLFELGPAPGDGQACQTVGSLGGGLCEFPGAGWMPDEVCIPSTETIDGDELRPGSRLALTVAGEVGCVYEPGPCDAELDAPTGVITLRPRLRSCDEGTPTWDCTGESGRLEQSCLTPELSEGSYTIVVDGLTIAELTVGEAAPARCVAL